GWRDLTPPFAGIPRAIRFPPSRPNNPLPPRTVFGRRPFRLVGPARNSDTPSSKRCPRLERVGVFVPVPPVRPPGPCGPWRYRLRDKPGFRGNAPETASRCQLPFPSQPPPERPPLKPVALVTHQPIHQINIESGAGLFGNGFERPLQRLVVVFGGIV